MRRFTETSLFYYCISILYDRQYICEIIVIDLQLKQIQVICIYKYLCNKEINFMYAIDRFLLLYTFVPVLSDSGSIQNNQCSVIYY